MGVSLVYLGRNDDDKEMNKMCIAIAAKLRQAHVEVQETNFADGKNLPQPNRVTQNEVWFCGHCRFVEANTSIRKTDDRNLGGFSITEIAEFAKSCVTRGRKKIRLVCCESAQQQRYQPKNAGKPPAGFEGVLGNELLQTVTNPHLLNQFGTTVDASVSHLEGLILAMAKLWGNQKANQPEFDICGLWGAGDITDDDVPITSFLQDMGSLEAQAKMNNPKVNAPQQKVFAATFKNAHCTNKGLPDFFGYRIRENLLLEWLSLPRGSVYAGGRHLGRTGRERARIKAEVAGQH